MHYQNRTILPVQGNYGVREVLGGDADIKAWQDFLAAKPEAGIYHDLAWRDIFASLGYRSRMLAAIDATGQIGGVLPLYRVPSLGRRPRLVAVPFRDRGGALFNGPDAFGALVASAGKVAADERAANVVLKTIEPYPAAAVEAAGLARSDYWVHSETDLRQLDADTLLRRLGDKTRNMIRQAEQAGLHVNEVEPHPNLDRWLHVYRKSQHLLGLPAFPGRFFERMLRLLGAGEKAKLFLVNDRDGNTVAASIVFLEKTRVIYGYSASTPLGREARANDLMLFRLLTWSMERGLQRFDMGSDSPLQEGLLFFKRKWLAKQTVIPTYHMGDSPAAPVDSSTGRFAGVRKIVARLPEPVSRLGLTPLIRYFG
ncbi:MAG: GNAT family N-acetyltransferase [Rhizobiaceae bacterium]|nr:GNAT family N-acetyltransferase [Rhizobiaceae bacterium]